MRVQAVAATSTGTIARQHRAPGTLTRALATLTCLALGLALGLTVRAATDTLQRLDGAVLLPHAANDGDSFHVRTGTTELAIRLYFVDCAETGAATEADARRVREQTRYFGLPNAQRTLEFGRQAKELAAKVLAQPFTVHTAYARALGRSATPRVYAFVITAANEDLATLLVKQGLARARGVGRETPARVSRDEETERLRDLEAAAMLKRVGVWAEANAERLAELRALERQEEQELEQFMAEPDTGKVATAAGPLDLNTATREQLNAVTGLRPDLVDAIVAGRPYDKVEDLLKVKGIGPKTLDKLRPLLSVAKRR